jgi:hypothetical protein
MQPRETYEVIVDAPNADEIRIWWRGMPPTLRHSHRLQVDRSTAARLRGGWARQWRVGLCDSNFFAIGWPGRRVRL